jgi:hypothetical protein
MSAKEETAQTREHAISPTCDRILHDHNVAVCMSLKVVSKYNSDIEQFTLRILTHSLFEPFCVAKNQVCTLTRGAHPLPLQHRPTRKKTPEINLSLK